MSLELKERNVNLKQRWLQKYQTTREVQNIVLLWQGNLTMLKQISLLQILQVSSNKWSAGGRGGGERNELMNEIFIYLEIIRDGLSLRELFLLVDLQPDNT